jgi:hypothetical protein
MSSRYLAVIIENASYVLTRSVPLLLAPNVDRHRALAFCTQYRRRGIALMLQKGGAAGLHRDLQRSGAAYAAFLNRAEEVDKTASKAAPFFDAVACGDFSTARSIADRVAGSVHTDQEYEDDFLYIRWLMGRFVLGWDSAVLAALLTRYEALLDGAADARLLICQAFERSNAALFDSALLTLIEMRADDYARGIEAEQIVEEEWATEGKVFVEAVALARFAASLGFNLESDYMFVPSLALGTKSASFDSSAWTNCEAP